MKKLIAFAIGTAAVIATAIGVQAFATSGHDDEGKRPPGVTSTEPPAPPGGSTTAPDNDTSGSGSETKDDDDREGSTEDHDGKPGEDK